MKAAFLYFDRRNSIYVCSKEWPISNANIADFLKLVEGIGESEKVKGEAMLLAVKSLSEAHADTVIWCKISQVTFITELFTEFIISVPAEYGN